MIREIECNICGVQFKSRQDISHHRQTKHQMFRKSRCKYYPDCVDEDECFFEHKDTTDNIQAGNEYFCRNGENCLVQTCKFSEKNHMSGNFILCRFQENCNTSSCVFKHISERRSFLGDVPINQRRK